MKPTVTAARNVVVTAADDGDRGRGEGSSEPFLHLLAAKDKALLDRRDAFLLFHLLLDLGDLVVGLDVELDLLARQGTNSLEVGNVSTATYFHAL